MSNLFVKQMELGAMQNYVYLVGSARTREVAVVDPAWDVDAILRAAADEGLKITDVLVSHGHFDHVNGVEDLVARTDARVHMQGVEVDFFDFELGGGNLRRAAHGDRIRVGDVEIELLHTPGHTPGSQCFAVHDRLVTGDTLFVDGCGRCDFKGGDPEAMYRTLHNLIGALPDETVVLPGHNYAPLPQDTLGAQKKTNRFFKPKTLEEFVSVRMAPRR